VTALAASPSLAEPSSTPAGLSSDEAQRRLTKYGPNTLRSAPRDSALREVLSALASPLMLVLLVASAVAAGLGQVVDATIIAVMVLLSIALNVVQSGRSRRAADRLRQSVAPTATVRRDGDWRELPRGDVVPGDLIRLSAGDLVPGDATLVESRDLHVQEAALTGESLPAEKEAVAAGGLRPTTAQCVFLGTSIVSGTGVAVVSATGRATQYGEIAERLRARAPATEFDRGLARLGALITRTVVLLVLFLVLVSVALHRDPLESLLFAVALAVGLVPEFMPMITSVTLANGAVRMSRRHVIVKHLAAIQNLGSIDVLCSDKTGTLTRGEMTLDGAVDLQGRDSADVLSLARLNARFETGIRSPLDAAIMNGAAPTGDVWTKLDEIPFDFERRRLSIVAQRGAERLLVSKGAPEAVFACCNRYADDTRVQPIDAGARDRLLETVHALGARGLRVLGVASRSVDGQAAYGKQDEHSLIFAGLLSFNDPPLDDAAETVASLRELGVTVKILTGDNDAVARSVCARTGIDASRVVLGDEVDHMSDAGLAHVAEQANVFARVSPQQKNRVLLALKHRGHVVGYLGDGINDAPSLHTADVGISVSSAADVAKDTADVILLERGLDVLRTGILEGRKAFGNVTKYLLMGTSSNFGNMFSMAAASLFLPFLPMLPSQILLNNFLYDLAQVAIPGDRVDEAYTRRPQRWDMRALRRFMVTIGPISSVFDFVTFGVLLLFFQAGAGAFHTGWFVESLVTQTLVLFVIRTPRSIFRSRPSRGLVVTVAGAVALGVLLPFTPLASPLGFVAPPASFLGYVVLVTVAYLTCVELAKRPLMRRLIS
jgi:Mg2+-importing ATPase